MVTFLSELTMMKTFLLIQTSLFLILLSVINESSSYAQDKKSATRRTKPLFQIANIENMTVLAHPVCRFQLPTEDNMDNYIFAEGDICPVGGGKCNYYALMNINRKDVKLRKVNSSQKSNNAKFKTRDLEVRINYISTKCYPNNKHCESTINSATLTIIFQGKSEKRIKVTGECGD